MLQTSQKFQDDMRRLYDRRVFARIQIDYSDPEIDQGIEVKPTENNYTSYPMQIVDGKATPSFKYASLDNSWVLGEGFALAPSVEEIDKYQYGLWGSSLSNADGTFSIPPVIQMTFIGRPIRSLKLVGDSKRNEYPVDFEFRLYKENNQLVYTETITNNTLVNWEKEIEQINQIVKMEIEIFKWNLPNRTIKILEVFSSIQEIYEGEDIISINLLEEKEVSQGSLPIGNISSNEIEIKLNNINREFDTGNKNSNLYGLVKPNRKVKIWMGTEDELVPLGLFWTKDWKVPEDDVVASTIGRDRLDRLRDTTYSTSTVQVNKTMYELAEMVLQDAGLNDEQYWLDDELKQFNVPYAYFKPVSHREALRQIATACLGQVYCDRYGVIRFEGPSYTLDRVKEIEKTSFLQAEFPADVVILDAYGISPDDYFRKDNPSRQSDIANHVTVETQPLRPDVVQEVYSSNESIHIDANENKTVTIQFNHTPCIDVTVSPEGTGSIVDTQIYAWGADVTISSTTSGEFVLKATGKPLKVMNKDKIMVKDDESIIDNGIIRYEFPTNHLIQNISTARVIAEKLLQYCKDPKRDLEIEWRGNPSLELGDIVVVNDYVRGDLEERGYYYITKQELEYAGYLRAKLEGRRAL
ncbi:MAG: hypothetical protein GX995_09265 [Clostridiales bacterium]|nr:hypothetical protein [Clostridiales bacterium]